MGFKRSFEDAYGNTYTDSYWYAGSVIIDKSENRGTIVMKGYKDQNARDLNRQSIGERTYMVAENNFFPYLERLLNGEQNVLAMAYEIVLSIKDVRTVNDEGNVVESNFFDGAEQV